MAALERPGFSSMLLARKREVIIIPLDTQTPTGGLTSSQFKNPII